MTGPRQLTGIGRALKQVPEAPAGEAAPGRPEPLPADVRPVRFTLDMSPEQHDQLQAFARSAKAPAAVVMRALVWELLSDPALAAKVREEANARQEALRQARRL
jgi:hypothetical protein